MNANLKDESENSINNLDNLINHKIRNLDIEEENSNKNALEVSFIESEERIFLLKFEKQIFSNFNKKYTIILNPNKIYNEFILHTLLFNQKTHLVSVFKDHMIYEYIDEFLNKYYYKLEIYEKLSKFIIFYKNYLSFFCQPVFSNLKYNNLVQRNRERKAELFYNKNFRDKDERSIEDKVIIENSDDEEEEYYDIEKTIFNETIKKRIEKYSPINTSLALPDSGTDLKPEKSGLLISFENESSLRNIIKNMINNKKNKRKLKNKFGEDLTNIKKGKLGINEFDKKIKINIIKRYKNKIKRNLIYKKNSSEKKKNFKILNNKMIIFSNIVHKNNMKENSNINNKNHNNIKLNFKSLTKEPTSLASSKNVSNTKKNNNKIKDININKI